MALWALLLLAPSLLGQTPNPVPFVHQPLVPTAVAPGGPDFTLTVNGAGFVPESVIQWNGTPRPTTFVSNTQLTAAIPAADIATIGSASVAVVNPATGGSSRSNIVFFHVTNPTSSVSMSRTDFATGAVPFSVTTADFNADSMLDLAVANYGDNTVSILLGVGDGTFQTQRAIATGVQSFCVTHGDFNADGKLDLVVANSAGGAGNTVSILLGIGDGTFQNPRTFPTGVGPRSVTAGDFNRDGKLDLATTGEYSNTVSILLGKGDGAFEPQRTYATGGNPGCVTTGDFNRDGKLDLAVANVTADTISILLGNGDGTFQTLTTFSGGFQSVSVTTADFNGDGKLDLAVPNDGENAVSILLGDGDGTFQTRTTFGTGAFPIYVTTGDFNGDNKLDLAVTNDQSVSILLGNGDGTFQTQSAFATSEPPHTGTPGDFNGDGRLDLAVPGADSNTVSVLSQPAPLAVVLSPTTLAFSVQRLGTPSSSGTATLTNNLTGPLTISSIALTGANTDEFEETNDCPLAPSTLAAGASCTISVTFFHTMLGPKTASVVISDDALVYPQQVLNLTGTVVDPAVTLSATSLDFGDQPVDVTSAAQTVTMPNSGMGNLTINGITATGDFAATNTCGTTLSQGAQCAISITFNPQEGGIFFGTVTISSNAAASPQIITLKGTGTPPTLTLSATSLTFGDQLVHTTSPPQTVTLTNNGPGPLTVGSTSQTNEFVVFSDCVGTVALSASCTISVTFHPEFNGTRTGTATIFDNAAGNPHTVSLTGTGLGPVATLSPTSLNFPNQPLGTSSTPQTVTLTNTGGATMTLSGIFATGPFEKTTTCTAILGVGASCTITVVFTPASTGPAHGSLSVNSDATGSMPHVELSGNGMDLQLALAPGAPDSATVTAGSAATFDLVLDPKGFVGAAGVTCTWNGQQPVGASCTVSPNPVSLNGADPAPVTIRVTTTARSGVPPPFGDHRSPLQPNPWARHAAPLMAALLGFMLVWMRMAYRGAPLGTRVRGLIPISTAILVMLLWVACGGGGSAPLTPKPPGTPAGNYTLNVTVTAGEVTQTTVLGLHVN